MKAIYENLIFIIWLIWIIYWQLVSRNVKAAVRRESSLSRAGHVLPLIIAALLLALPSLPGGFLCGRVLPSTEITYWIGVVVLVAGLVFSVWARIHIGRNWSGIVTLKQEHELIRSGPYRLVRHPIYTGLLLGFIGTAIARDEWRGWLAVLIVFAALWRKLRLEERWLTQQFGEPYSQYRDKVAALIPYLL
ncbi:MAG TPA: isoprenylcysteine carboxylmethyltransferase family protein [Gammaproteobacteria bacterium]|nr:isoprenylcysteine carboxylmethyltransferase family protein [Gammaproteobacteria bacterium]